MQTDARNVEYGFSPYVSRMGKMDIKLLLLISLIWVLSSKSAGIEQP